MQQTVPVDAEMAARWSEQEHDGKKQASGKLGFEELPFIVRSEAVFLEPFTPIAAKASGSTPKTFYS